MASPASDLDVDQLAAAARELPSGPNFARLWEAVFGLENWYLLPTGNPADPRPMVGMVDDQSFLLVFTSERGATRFAVNHHGIADDDGIAAMSITPAALADLAPNLVQQGVSGVLFDQGTGNFLAPVAALATLYNQFRNGGTPVGSTDMPAG